MSKLTVGQVFKYFAPSGTALIAIVSFLFLVAKPHAEEFIHETVNEENFASQRSLDAIDLRSLKSQTDIDAIRNVLGEVQAQQKVIANDLLRSRELEKETREDIRTILRGVKSLQQ